MDPVWTLYGPPMDPLLTLYGPSMVPVWTLMDPAWSHLDPMDPYGPLWTLYEPSMDPLCTLYGPLLYPYRATKGALVCVYSFSTQVTHSADVCV